MNRSFQTSMHIFRARRSWLRLAGAVIALLLVSGILGCPREASDVGAVKTPTKVAATGDIAPDFVGNDIDGKPIKLSNHLGKQVVLLDFCSTWCEPCVTEFPHLRTLYAANKAKGFLILAISLDGPETVANVPNFARRNQLSFPMMLDDDSRIAALYNPRKAAPFAVLIDRTGKIVHMHEGYTAGDELTLATEVAKALGQNMPSPN